MPRLIAASSLRFGALLVFLAGCGPEAEPVAWSRPATPVRVEAVRQQSFAPVLVTPGIVEAEARIELAFRVGGLLARFLVDEGDRVEAGDPIAELDRVDLERAVETQTARLSSASAQVAEADLAFDRQQRLLELASTSRKTFDVARLERQRLQAEVRHARLALAAARDDLERGTLRAPIAGTVERRLIEEHEHAAARVPVVVLSALDGVVVRAAVADEAVGRLERGATARVRSAAWPGRAFPGRVRRVAVAADPTTRAFPFEVELANPDLALRPEMVVELEVELGEASRSLAVPLAAVLRGVDARPFCFALVDASDGLRAERRPLELGIVSGALVAVLAGLDPGERVVTRGQHFLSPRDRVRVIEAAP